MSNTKGNHMTDVEVQNDMRTQQTADEVEVHDAGETGAEHTDPQPGEGVQSAQEADGGEQLEQTDTESQEDRVAEQPQGVRTPNRREVNAARKFGLDEEDLAVLTALGDRGRQLVERLVKADSDLGRRYSRIGRAERVLGRSSSPASDGARGDDDWAGMARQLRQLREQVAELVQDVQHTRAGHQSEAAERCFAGLDPEVYSEFGRGRSEDLEADSPELRKRQELLTKAAEIRRGYELVHGKPMDGDESLRQALSIVAADAQSQSEQRRLAHQLRRRSRQRISRPTQRRGGESYESAAEKTGRALEEWEKTRGIKFFAD